MRPLGTGGAALGIALLWTSPAQGQVGVLGGFNENWLSDIESTAGTLEAEPTPGYHLGLFLNLNLAVLGIRSGITYHRLSGLTLSTGTDSLRVNVDMVEIPIDLRIRLPLPIVKPYLLAGPVLSFQSSGNQEVDGALASSALRVDVGIGVEIDLGLRLWPEVRVGFGVNDYFRETIAIGDDVLEPGARLTTVLLTLGVSF